MPSHDDFRKHRLVFIMTVVPKCLTLRPPPVLPTPVWFASTGALLSGMAGPNGRGASCGASYTNVVYLQRANA